MNGFGYAVDSFAAWLAGGEPGAIALAIAVVVVWILPMLLLVFPVAAFGQILERKIAAAVQRRIGPNAAGLEGPLRFGFAMALCFLPRATRERLFTKFCALAPVRGLLRIGKRLGLGQFVADGIKMLGKEDIVPRGADGYVFRLAPYLALVGAFVPWVVVPWSHHLVMLETPVAALFAIAVSGIVVVALKMAGWGSGSKWSLLGGMRAVSQLVSYEVPIGLCVGGVVVWCGTMDLHAIVAHQYHPGVFSVLGWNALQSPFLLLLAGVFFVAGLAECQRSPFDMAEAESELVSGVNTEYSGLRWGMFAMAEYTEMLLIGALLATLFLGGYQSPLGEEWIVALPVWLEIPVHVLVFGAKVLGSFLVMMWIRWTLPRFRVDQVMRLSWLVLVPLCLLSLFGVALTLLAAGGTSPGTAYGRLPGAPHADLSWLGHLLAWAVPVLAGGFVVRLAQKRHGQVHPALQKLTGGGA